MGVLMSVVSHNGSFKCGYVPALTIGHIFRAHNSSDFVRHT